MTAATDGNGSTDVRYEGHGSDNYIKYTFPAPATINAFQLYYDAYHYIIVEFFDANGVSITKKSPSTSSFGTTKETFAEPVSNVSEIRFYPDPLTTDQFVVWHEIDVFGTISVPVITSPTGLAASALNNSVSLNWSAATGATSYNIKRSTTAGGPYTTIATAVTGTTYADTGLTNGTTYYYVVTAVNADGESGNSNEASATPTAPASSGRALLTIHLVGGAEKEYDLTATELDNFLDWTESATQNSKYKFVKTWNKGPFKARAEYVVFGKIVNFDVDEYDPAE